MLRTKFHLKTFKLFCEICILRQLHYEDSVILFCGTFDVTQQFMIFQQLFISITFVARVYSTKTGVAIKFDKPTTVLFQLPLEYNAGLPINQLLINAPFIK
jgi:hypothetical protein